MIVCEGVGWQVAGFAIQLLSFSLEKLVSKLVSKARFEAIFRSLSSLTMTSPARRLKILEGFESLINRGIQKTLAVKRANFCSRGGRIRTCDLLVPNQAP